MSADLSGFSPPHRLNQSLIKQHPMSNEKRKWAEYLKSKTLEELYFMERCYRDTNPRLTHEIQKQDRDRWAAIQKEIKIRTNE